MTAHTASGETTPAVKSQPLYTPLSPDPAARHHLLVAEAAGLEAVKRVLDALAGVDGEAAPVEVFWLGEVPATLAARIGVAIQTCDALPALCEALAQRLSSAGMGLRLYLAGRESFVWQLDAPARAAGLREDEIRREACGTAARRVFCVHCRTLSEDVTTSPVQCPACGIWLEVRDHFSRTLAAYIGVVANAEDPAVRPESEARFA